MPEITPFPCNGCGKCCRKIAEAVAFAKEAGFQKEVCDFPYKWDEQGVCEMLTPGNRCKVYGARPLLCNVKEMYKYMAEYFKQQGQEISYDAYVEYNRYACQIL
jgi:Fe-S-cluster containining protein